MSVLAYFATHVNIISAFYGFAILRTLVPVLTNGFRLCGCPQDNLVQ